MARAVFLIEQGRRILTAAKKGKMDIWFGRDVPRGAFLYVAPNRRGAQPAVEEFAAGGMDEADRQFGKTCYKMRLSAGFLWGCIGERPGDDTFFVEICPGTVRVCFGG